MSNNTLTDLCAHGAMDPLPSDFHPKVGIVLGSGLGEFTDGLEIVSEVSYADIPGLPVSKVPGHSGKLIYASVGGVPWAILKGRVHLYEGRAASEVTAGVRLCHALGCEVMILTNAAGTLKQEHAPGTWMQLTDHLNLTGTTPLLGGANFVDLSAVYDPQLIADFQRLAEDSGLTLHRGVYAGLLGPQYETPAEIRMLRTFGADAVGMSTVLEAIQAKALGMRVAGFSCLTNWAAGMHPGELNHQEVLETGKNAAQGLCRLLEQWSLTLKD
jgi:purine-nucleoside phosphorylase